MAAAEEASMDAAVVVVLSELFLMDKMFAFFSGLSSVRVMNVKDRMLIPSTSFSAMTIPF